MSTLIEQLEQQIARQEAKRGPDDPFVKDLKEQLRASKATQGKSTEEVFKLQAQPLPSRDPQQPFLSSNLRLFTDKKGDSTPSN